jgi:hypothetical protein
MLKTHFRHEDRVQLSHFIRLVGKVDEASNHLQYSLKSTSQDLTAYHNGSLICAIYLENLMTGKLLNG